MLKSFLLIFIGGGIGSALRYLSTLFVQKYFPSIFPTATLLVNVLGCFLIGILIGLLDKNQLSNPNLKLLLITGFCGGFTTFSAFGLENIVLLQNNNSIYAFAYIALSIVLGLFAVWLGLFISK